MPPCALTAPPNTCAVASVIKTRFAIVTLPPGTCNQAPLAQTQAPCADGNCTSLTLRNRSDKPAADDRHTAALLDPEGATITLSGRVDDGAICQCGVPACDEHGATVRRGVAVGKRDRLQLERGALPQLEEARGTPRVENCALTSRGEAKADMVERTSAKSWSAVTTVVKPLGPGTSGGIGGVKGGAGGAGGGGGGMHPATVTPALMHAFGQITDSAAVALTAGAWKGTGQPAASTAAAKAATVA
eukprot:6797719-Prymnesium_polylepis.1